MIEKSPGYLKWRKARKWKRFFTTSLVILGIGGGVGIGYTIFHKVQGTRKFQIVHLPTDNTPEDGVLRKGGQEIVLQAENGSGHIIWDGLAPITNIEYEYITNSILRIKAIGDINEIRNIEITATDTSGNTASVKISTAQIVYNPIPLNAEYFNIEYADEKPVIKGFSSEVINEQISLDNFNAFDFSNESNIVYIHPECQFNSGVFDKWHVQKIDLSNLVFLNEFRNVESDLSGFEMFANSNFSSLINLNFGDSTWYGSLQGFFPAPGLVASADSTFANANMSALTNLNFGSAKFAYPYNLTIRDSISINTAFQTFFNADLRSLNKLDFGRAEFVISNMVNYGDGSVKIGTAYETFASANLKNLKELDFGDSQFSAANMVSNEMLAGTINTADNTFNSVEFDNLETLDLSNVTFASKNNSNTTFNSAYGTFSNATFNNLNNLELKNATFACQNMTAGDNNNYINTAAQTFDDAKFYELDKLDLDGVEFATTNMSENGAIINTADATFSNAIFPNLRTIDSLNLQGAEFAANNMTAEQTGGEVYTASSTFESAHIDFLPELNLGEVNFAEENIGGGSVHTAYHTFYDARMANLLTLDFFKNPQNLSTGVVFSKSNNKNNQSELRTADGTFENVYLPRLDELNLANVEFATDDEHSTGDSDYTGSETFRNANLSNVETLNLSNTKFAAKDMDSATTNSQIHTAYCTFQEANLRKMSNLNFYTVNQDYVSFAHQDMGSTYIYTADSTFKSANLSGLSTLNLDDVSFIANDMTVGDRFNAGYIYTAHNTFESANLSNLNQLSLQNTKFSASELESNQAISNIYTGYQTFKNSQLQKLQTLNLFNAEFASEKMEGNTGTIDTACETFMNAIFSELKNLNLSGTKFAVNNMLNSNNGGGIMTAHRTFALTNLSTLESGVLNLKDTIFAPQSIGSSNAASIAFETFAEANLPNATTILLPESYSSEDKLFWIHTFTNLTPLGSSLTIYTLDGTQPVWFGEAGDIQIPQDANWRSYPYPPQPSI